ncbi:hypothetical protein PENSPDRAFT_40515 [Peniophora sp. CONT]|nr:hypothetical protein PENSPDRAFT_40515 [Peniophora sp. CONT]
MLCRRDSAGRSPPKPYHPSVVCVGAARVITPCVLVFFWHSSTSVHHLGLGGLLALVSSHTPSWSITRHRFSRSSDTRALSSGTGPIYYHGPRSTRRYRPHLPPLDTIYMPAAASVSPLCLGLVRLAQLSVSILASHALAQRTRQLTPAHHAISPLDSL